MSGRAAKICLFAFAALSLLEPSRLAQAETLVHADASNTSPPTPTADQIPRDQTPADRLSTPSYRHHEVLRIRRDFGKAHFIIALDAWVPRTSPTNLTEVRLWWINLRHGDRRGPFSKRTMSHFEIEYTRNSPTSWDILLLSDERRFRFRVELASDGQVRAFATVVDPNGERIRRCHASKAELIAKRFLNIPSGIDALVVTCRDPSGTVRVAPVVTDGSF